MWSVKDKITADAIEADRLRPNFLPPSFSPQFKFDYSFHQGRPNTAKNTAVTNVLHSVEEGKAAEHSCQMKQFRDISANKPATGLQSADVFYSEFFLTSVKTEQQLRKDNYDEILQKYLNVPNLKIGRPDLQQLFADTAKLCTDEGIPEVAVVVCGPDSMVNAVDDLCRRSQLTCDSRVVQFFCHKEVFNF